MKKGRPTQPPAADLADDELASPPPTAADLARLRAIASTIAAMPDAMLAPLLGDALRLARSLEAFGEHLNDLVRRAGGPT